MKYVGVLIAVLIAGVAAEARSQENTPDIYAALRLQGAYQGINGQQAYSPRALDITRGPGRSDALAGGIALGVHLPGNWRVETEYVLPTRSEFETQWRFRNPANGFVGNSRNVIETRSQRLMINGYKDFPLTPSISLFAGLGLGLSRIDADGYQGVTNRRFERSTSNNLAWSATLGANFRLTGRLTLGAGYRHVDLGKYQTGTNLFLNNASGQRDEQHRGRLTEQNLFVELRAGF